MNTPTLLPCPFCGEQASIYYTGSCNTSGTMLCPKCGARGPCTPNQTMSEAWQGWNTRTIPLYPSTLLLPDKK